MALVNSIVYIVVAIGSILGSTRVNGRVISPQVNTIKTQNGDIYDCVDFYEQPAFQHPLLRNHSYHPKMEPSFTPKRIDGKAKTKNTKELFFGLKDGGCPFGTVPIRRVTKEQRDRATNFLNDRVNSSFTPNEVPTDPGLRWAIVQSKSGPATPNYFGVGAYLGILNPKVKDDVQYSSAQCMIMNGPNYIEFGWTVNPMSLYQDHQTRMYILTKAGETRCYNTDCPGFVIVRQDYPLDAVLSHYSSSEELVTLNMMVYHDPKGGNWWLTVVDEQTKIGFWPGHIFSHLANFGTYVECGGKAYSLISEDPDIGTGKMPTDNLYYDAYVENLETINDKFDRVDAKDTETFVTTDKYAVHDWGITEDTDHTFVYGGPRLPY